ncbi:MAG: NAD+ synthase [Thermoanaerobaculia bacterium]|nr:NAD+ synthase [Thermoanaerobaculia bacterium]
MNEAARELCEREAVPAPLRINGAVAERMLVAFCAQEVRKVGFERVVVGLSGGIDSAVSAYLAARALGPERVHAFFLPYRESDPGSKVDAGAIAAVYGLALRTIDITPQIDAYFEREEPDADRVRRGNKMARERMTILFDQSKKLASLVIGTSNKTEILLGYSTVFGDNASAFNPLGDLYKTQVRALARQVGVPEAIAEKPASADLWPGQRSESELGFDYATADEILFLLFDQGLLDDEVVARGYPAEVVAAIVRRERDNRFKRRMMLIARLSGSAVNLDREIPRD